MQLKTQPETGWIELSCQHFKQKQTLLLYCSCANVQQRPFTQRRHLVSCVHFANVHCVTIIIVRPFIRESQSNLHMETKINLSLVLHCGYDAVVGMGSGS